MVWSRAFSVDISTNTLMKPRSWHYWISLLLFLGVIPALRSQHLPLKFDWITLGISYWFLLSAQSIFAAVILSLLGLPRIQVLEPLVARYRKNPLRIVPLLFYFAILAWVTTWVAALVLTVDAIAL